jgi:hypothetical protein
MALVTVYNYETRTSEASYERWGSSVLDLFVCNGDLVGRHIPGYRDGFSASVYASGSREARAYAN